MQARSDAAPTRARNGQALSVSVIIPVRDDAQLLRRCLHALAQQTVAPLEIIVVDNGSHDETADVARAAGVILVRQPEPGVLAASAAGYDAAAGDLLARLDADCVPGADWVRSVVDAFADPAVAAVTGGAHLVEGPARMRRLVPAAYLAAYYGVLTVTLGHVPLFGSNMAMRRDAWIDVSSDVHRHDELVHDDLDIAFHLGETHRIRYEPNLSMGISARPFGDLRSFIHRIRRGYHSVIIHWPRQFPPFRWTRLALHAARRAGATTPR
jgi:glycosyltransferase involved in cell wall biosynthesis